MIIGVPKEIKNNENRVGLTPENIDVLTHSGHTVYVQREAGVGTGFLPDEYQSSGAQILDTIE
ncbi:alanine dehydrogenase, partial [bacterium]|nr:alanine dehydrogenase [bacterium]